MERFIVGLSADVEAEYAMRADAPVTILCLFNEEPVSVEGFFSIQAAQDDLRRNEVSFLQIEYVGSI